MKNKKILITGGAGFIVSKLATKLVHLGYKTTVIDFLMTRPEIGVVPEKVETEMCDEIEGVLTFFGSDFITVGKSNDFSWDILKPSILNEISEHSENPYVVEQIKPACETLNSDVGTNKVTKQIKELLDTRVRPAVAQDGGDIIFHSFKNNTVYLEMYGACSGCPSSTATLKMGIENMLKHYVPEVKEVRPVNV